MGIFNFGLLEILLVCVGISFDVMAVSLCYGAKLMRIEKKKLAQMTAIFTFCQTAAVMLGEMVLFIPLFRENSENAESLRNACSIIILMALGVFLLYKGWKQEDIFEKCEDINFKEVWIASLIASIDSLFAGVGFALWSVNQIEVFASVIVITALAVILGVYIGYRLGWEPKKKAYYIGAAVLLVSAADVLIRLLAK